MTNTTGIRVAVVDDHAIVRQSIKTIVNDEPDMSVVLEASNGESVLDFARNEPLDVILMDISMPGIGGLEATSKLQRVSPSTQVIAISTHTKGPFPSRLLKAGATGYLTKESPPQEIVRAIRTVFRGEPFITSSLALTMAFDKISIEKSPTDLLSSRELQIMTMITRGESVDTISRKLCLSTKTINAHRYRIFEKLHIKSDVELTLLAFEIGMLDI